MEIITQNTIQNRRVVRVVLTGGVSAGKSSVLNWLKEQKFNVPTAFVSEGATELLEAGYTPERFGLTAFQHTVFRKQLEKERTALHSLLRQTNQEEKPGLLLCDRGLCDCAAYLSPDAFQIIHNSFGLTRRRVIGRYQVVLFMDSVATLSEYPFDACRGNKYRRESDPAEITMLNEKTWEAWGDHPSMVRITATPTFEEKLMQTKMALEMALEPWYGDTLMQVTKE